MGVSFAHAAQRYPFRLATQRDFSRHIGGLRLEQS
jgi:hypothetical protein